MSYRIYYDTAPAAKKSVDRHFERRSFIFRLFVVLLVCFFGVCILSGHADGLLDYILPGDPETTRNAINTMSNEIKAGSSLKEAVATFCKEILKDVQ